MRALQVSRALIRSFCSTARGRVENRVPENQKRFQENNDLPVYLKGGRKDTILYLATMALTMGGTAYSLYFLTWAACPHKK